MSAARQYNGMAQERGELVAKANERIRALEAQLEAALQDRVALAAANELLHKEVARLRWFLDTP